MKYYGKAENVAESIINAFESGNIPEALSQVFIHRNDDIPCNSWSWRNQLITALCGTYDARGFKQWQEVGRQVVKGAKAFYILGPCTTMKTVTNPQTGQEEQRPIVYAFKSIPVFSFESTELVDAETWEQHSTPDVEHLEFMQSLPFVDVAQKWGLSVESFNGQKANYLGMYRHGQSIALGTKNLSTWAHELTHAADDKNNTIVKGFGQIKSNEVVAEFGGAILLTLVGMKYDADLGGAWNYIQSYSDNDKNKALKLCSNLIERTCNAVAKILETAENVQFKQAA